MDRLRGMLARDPEYEPLEVSDDEASDSLVGSLTLKPRFSRLEYTVFLLLGVAQLWAWNMFLAAAPYFQHRFHSNDWILANFQSAILSVSSVTSLSAVLILVKMQKGASYPYRIAVSLVMNMVIFTLLAISTIFFRGVSAAVYFGFLLIMVCTASLAAALSQNGLFAYVSGFGRAEYTQAIMTGQAVAGVLPCVAQIVSVLAVRKRPVDGPNKVPSISPRSAFGYFMAATLVSGLALLALLSLLKRERQSAKAHNHHHHNIISEEVDNAEEQAHAERRNVGLVTLFLKLRWPSMAIFLCFAITMVFPVFTVKILSVHNNPPIVKPATFIPLAFLIWNSGDLAGRLLTLIPRLNLTPYPRLLFFLAIARAAYIPLYLLCNIDGAGAYINSDFFYLAIVQLTFGITNGFLGSSCMIGAPTWVAAEEREASGGFMSLMLVAGLTTGSLLSFLIA